MNYNFNRLFYKYVADADIKEADYDGWLLKQSKYIAVWRKRFFTLKGKYTSGIFFSRRQAVLYGRSKLCTTWRD